VSDGDSDIVEDGDGVQEDVCVTESDPVTDADSDLDTEADDVPVAEVERVVEPVPDADSDDDAAVRDSDSVSVLDGDCVNDCELVLDGDTDPVAVAEAVGEPRDVDAEGDGLGDNEAESVTASVRDSIMAAATRTRAASMRL
jgi:hypothetical protein